MGEEGEHLRRSWEMLQALAEPNPSHERYDAELEIWTF